MIHFRGLVYGINKLWSDVAFEKSQQPSIVHLLTLLDDEDNGCCTFGCCSRATRRNATALPLTPHWGGGGQ